MIHVKHSVLIHRPVEMVWVFMSDITNATRWDRGIVEARQTSPGPLGVGATLETVKLWFGQRRRLTYRIVEWEANRVIAFEAHGGPFERAIGRYSMVPTESGAQLTGDMQAWPRGIFRLLGPLIAHMGASDNRADLANVQRILEASV